MARATAVCRASSLVARHRAAQIDAAYAASLGTLVERLGRLSDERMRQIGEALEIAVGCEA